MLTRQNYYIPSRNVLNAKSNNAYQRAVSRSKNPTKKQLRKFSENLDCIRSATRQSNLNLVKDYISDINQFYIRETLTSLHENYMSWQQQINSNMRQILIDWMILIHDKFKLKENTLHMAVNLVDKYCFVNNILKHKYQLLGITCLFISAKYQQVQTPKIKQYVSICDGAYRLNELLSMESDILLALNFNIQPILINWLVQTKLNTIFAFNNIDEQTIQRITKICLYIANLILIQYEFYTLQANYLSVAIISFGCSMQNIDINKLNLNHIIQKQQLSCQISMNYLNRINNLWLSRSQKKFKTVNFKFEENNQQCHYIQVL